MKGLSSDGDGGTFSLVQLKASLGFPPGPAQCRVILFLPLMLVTVIACSAAGSRGLECCPAIQACCSPSSITCVAMAQSLCGNPMQRQWARETMLQVPFSLAGDGDEGGAAARLDAKAVISTVLKLLLL